MVAVVEVVVVMVVMVAVVVIAAVATPSVDFFQVTSNICCINGGRYNQVVLVYRWYSQQVQQQS